jgi:hypothetical protein
MATSAPISVDEYLKITYDPDAEYVDGTIEEPLDGGVRPVDVAGSHPAMVSVPSKGMEHPVQG